MPIEYPELSANGKEWDYVKLSGLIFIRDLQLISKISLNRFDDKNELM